MGATLPFGFKMGLVLIIPMLALVPWSVEGESVTGCCAVTFYNLLIIIELCKRGDLGDPQGREARSEILARYN